MTKKQPMYNGYCLRCLSFHGRWSVCPRPTHNPLRWLKRVAPLSDSLEPSLLPLICEIHYGYTTPSEVPQLLVPSRTPEEVH